MAMQHTVAGELRRDRLIDLLAERWRRRLITVTAPAGFGKTTALAQARADNAEDPTGLDVVVSCREVHRRPLALANEILKVLGADPVSQQSADDELVEHVVHAVIGLAPNLVCIVLDDVHRLGDEPIVGRFLMGLLADLPTQGSLLLAGRTLPTLATSRLRAADQLVSVDGDDLRFDDDEVRELTSRHDGVPGAVIGLDGWPAAVRLALVSGSSAPSELLLEDVAGGLGREARRLLVAGSMMGEVTPVAAAALAPTIDLDHFAAHTPLVGRTVGGGLRPHDLWDDALAPDTTAEMRTEVAEVVAPLLADDGRHDDALRVAARHLPWPLGRRFITDAVRRSDTELTESAVRQWAAWFDTAPPDSAEMLLLTGLAARLGRGGDAGLEEIHRAFRLAAADEDHEALVVLASELGTCGWLANDDAVMAEAILSGPGLIEAGYDEVAGMLVMAEAAMAEMSGDFEQASRVLGQGDASRLPMGFQEIWLRYEGTCSMLHGDADQAVSASRALVALNPTDRNRMVLAYTLMQAGEPAEAVEVWEALRYTTTDNLRDDYPIAVKSAMYDVHLGLVPDVDRVRSLCWDRSREQTFLAYVEATALLASGEETAAAAHLGAALERLDLDDPMVGGEARRFIAHTRVLCPDLAGRLHAGPIGVQQRWRLDLAELLLDLRAGHDTGLGRYPGADRTLSALPLVWSVELAARLHHLDADLAVELMTRLAALTDARAFDELARQADAEPGGVADRFRGVLPTPTPTVEVQAFGECSLRRGDGAQHTPRTRVRQLLGLLVLHAEVSRERIGDLMWPELDPARAKSNLAITLTHLRDDLEPDRAKGEPTFHLRERSGRLGLHRSDSLRIDLWECLADIERGDVAMERRDHVAARAAYRSAIGRWHAEPLPALDDVPAAAPMLADVRATLRRAALSLARLELSAGAAGDAAATARRVLRDDPLSEEAHRLVIAAALARGDTGSARHAADQLLMTLGELGLTPDEATRTVVRRTGLTIG